MPSGDCELSKLDYASSIMKANVMCLGALNNNSYDVAPGDLLFAMDINHVSNFIERSRIMYVVDEKTIIRPDQPDGEDAPSWLEMWESPIADAFYMITACCTDSSRRYIDTRRVGQACVACIKTLNKIYRNNSTLSNAVNVLELWSEGKSEIKDVIRIKEKFSSRSDSQLIIGILQLCDFAIYGGEFTAGDCVVRVNNCLAMHTDEYLSLIHI